MSVSAAQPDCNNATNKKDHSGEKGVDAIMLWMVIITSAFIIIIIGLALMWLRKYRSLMRIIRDLQNSEQLSSSETNPVERGFASAQPLTLKLRHGNLSTTAAKRQNIKSASRSLCMPPQMVCRFNKGDLNLYQLIKAGREGVFYKAKMVHGTIKGHAEFTCKVSKKGCSQRQMEREVSIMQKLGTHKNLLQILDWEITETPYILVMENVDHGSLRSFLQVNKDRLCRDKDLQHLFTVAAYHIAHAMEHLQSRMIMHCDLALRNIFVHRFPHEIKITEFRLAREITRLWSKRGSSKKASRDRIPSRWYPPEYFQNDYYGFKGDVWAFGIVVWEMQTFGTLPYPNLSSSEEVARYVCDGHRNSEPEQCRQEMLQIMQDCWKGYYSLRPSFKDIVRVLENILENDRDYLDMHDCRNQSVTEKPENSEQLTESEGSLGQIREIS